jgi:hypothetical protein
VPYAEYPICATIRATPWEGRTMVGTLWQLIKEEDDHRVVYDTEKSRIIRMGKWPPRTASYISKDDFKTFSEAEKKYLEERWNIGWEQWDGDTNGA